MAYSEREPFKGLLSSTSTLRFGSEEDTCLCCRLCELSGLTVSANGYCQNCQENLCDNCIASHHRNHIVNRNSVSLSAAEASDKLQNCSTHQNEEVNLYCRVHEKFGCATCIKSSHELCEIDFFPEVSEKSVKQDDILSFQKSVKDLKERCADALCEIEENVIDIEEAYANAVSAVEKTRKEITEELDRFERELKEEVTAYKKQNLDAMESLRKAYDEVVKDIADTEKATYTNSLSRNNPYNLLFWKAVAKVLQYQSKTYELSTRLCVKEECEFQKNTGLKAVLTKENLFGVIKIKATEVGPCNTTEELTKDSVCHINIKGKGDRKTCYATGLAFLSPDRLAVADKANKNVKIVNVSNDKIISEIGLSSRPRDVTVIPPKQLAVTLRDEERIQLLSTAKELTKTGQIRTAGKCRGIKYDDGKLVVAYDVQIRPKIEILSLNGDVLCRFQSNESGTMLVTEPKCIDLSPDHNHIYITDLSKRCVLRLSRLGMVTGTFGRHRFIGVAVSTGGSVYACSKAESTVYQLSDDMSKDVTVLTTDDGIKEPIALVFSKTRNMLYVSCGSTDAYVSNKLHVFKIKYVNTDDV
ncbi:uncharacterized protein LOC123542768 [Mercenaria mercenaria]|uniref:uncharacterized protein LOC123542768 n=1 Tax=Mercenaria mercenaria TaxID=6596 RepID=UPI00234EE2DC|nr:uncharacterized protein LOC123542768 [Mercenaria mercenaria]